MSRTLRGEMITVSALMVLTLCPMPSWAQSPVVLAVSSNATFRRGALAPGYIAAVFGTDLNNGSTVLSSFGPDGKLLTSLGGTTVTINNIPAPLFYSTRLQLGIQIPFELSGQSTATIQVTVGNQTSAPLTIPLAPFAPTLFESTRDTAGLPEAGATFHEDGVTPVTFESPARRGEVIVIYALGLGTLTPVLATGAPAANNRTLATPIVDLGGIPNDVQFAGSTPGFVGLYQVNVRIVPGVSAGHETLVLSIGGTESNAVTIAVQ